MKNIILGISAHVDAGKTTLSEALLFTAGEILKLGRVDKRTSFLDTDIQERERGITIFSKQALINLENTCLTLIDTPGHADFAYETERSISVQDYAILVISAEDGVTAHTRTIWNLLERKRVPTFVFVNKTDISKKPKSEILEEIRASLSDRCQDFTKKADMIENIAGADEMLIEEFFDTGTLSDESIANAIFERRLFPVYFGSALKLAGVDKLLLDIDLYTKEKSYNERLFGAKVYKISKDKQGNRLTYLKVTGGTLSAKDSVTVKTGGESVKEKVEEIRLYSGEKYKSVKSVKAGSVCAVTGLCETRVGMGLGFEKSEDSILTPVLDYRLNLPEGENVYEAYLKLRPLIEEEPSLNISYDPALKEIRVSLMGEIQLEVFERLIFERFGIKASFGEGAILYKETVKDAVFGAGHFEPLRHYAEVHLLIEPLPRGSGIVAATDCSLDALARGWQRLVLTHIEEKLHRGVLTGSPITDVRITLVAGKAHIKHTEGGDFRQATYRAVRQALMKAESVLLEPSFNFRIEVPSEHLGRVLTDVFAMKGETNQPENDGITATVSGVCPVATMRGYAKEIRAYTRGEGKITLAVGDYIPCHNSDEVIEKIGYNPMLDERNTPNSVFCKAGSGYVVPWDEADALMHVRREDCSEDAIIAEKAVRQRVERYTGTVEEDKELMRIFESTYGKIKPRRFNEKTENAAKEVKEPSQKPKKAKPKGEDYLLIDGYNFIFAADSLRALAERDISLARDTVTRIMCDYSAFKRCKVMIVFDAYRRRGGEGSVEELGEVSVVYTKESETADAFIERTTHALAKEHTVRVVTQDMQEQFVVLGSGGLRVSAKEFLAELKITEKEIKETIESFK